MSITRLTGIGTRRFREATQEITLSADNFQRQLHFATGVVRNCSSEPALRAIWEPIYRL